MNRRSRMLPLCARAARIALACTVFAAPLVSCGDNTAVTVDVARLEVTPATATAQAGATVTLTARAFDADGNSIPSPVLRWSSNDISVAAVAPTGAVTTIAAGTARISVSSMGRSALATITVTPRAVASIVVTPAQASLVVGRTARLTAQPLDAGGAPLPGRAVAWASSDVTVARVDDAGTITGVAPGAATIVATAEGRSAQVAVTVTLPPVQSVSVSPAHDTLAVNGARQFSAELRDGGGAVLAGRSITWTTSNTAVAIVSATGAVTALTPGIATITATSEGRSANATLVVLTRLASAVTVTPSVASIIVGNTIALAVQLTDAQGNVLTGRPVTFTSEAPSIASVSASGVVTALNPGSARIVVSSEGRSGAATVTVNPVPVATLSLSPTAISLITGEQTTLVPTPRSAAGTVLTGRTIEWRSGAPNVATVSGSGLVTAIAPGTALLLATVEGVTATSTVTVRVPPVSAIVLSPLAPAIDPGQSVQIGATTRDANGATLTGRVITWSSSNEQVAFVSSTGLVVGSRPGTAVITATSEGISASTTVTVR